jgi:tetratricopeptide (TPR) repeat protein
LEQYETLLTLTDDVELKALAYHNMGRPYQQMNEKAQARRYYRKAVNLKPDFELAQEHLGELDSPRRRKRNR